MLIRQQTHSVRILLLILLIAFVLRVLGAVYLGNTVSGLSGAHDEISYSLLGQRFADGYGMTFPEPWYPWIQPDTPQSYYSYTISLYLAGIYTLFGYHPLIARLLTAVLSTIIVYMIFLLGRRLFNEWVALMASAVAALYAYLIFYGVTLVTETPFTLAVLVALYIALRIRAGEWQGWTAWFGLGLALAVAVLLRMAVIFFIPFLLLWLVLELRLRTRLVLVSIPVLMIVVAVLPLTLRNYQIWDHFLLLEAQFGHVFWNGNHPGHLGDFHPYRVFPIPEAVLQSKNDVVITNTLLRMGLQNVWHDPQHFALLTLTRLREFFLFWPTTTATTEANLLRVLSFGLVAPFTVIGLLVNLTRFRDLAPIYLFIVVHTGIYAVTWTMIRYRIPLDPLFILLAASALDLGYRRITEYFAGKKALREAL